MARSRAVAVNIVLVTVLSLPCALGYNVLSGVVMPGIGDIQSIEDFILSNNMLPLGSLAFLVFCVSKCGWGWNNFIAEADRGSGARFPAWSYRWVSVGIPILIVIIFVAGYITKIAAFLGL